jgi:4-hydroxy-3-methylbut-2-enyl diphosphate reductase IspH
LDFIQALVVLWWKNSSNTKELVKIWENAGKKVFFIEFIDEIDNIKSDIKKYDKIWVTWWASTPIDQIYKLGDLLNKL